MEVVYILFFLALKAIFFLVCEKENTILKDIYCFYEVLPYFKHRVSCMFCQANCIDLEVDLFPKVYFFKN